jgi:hypothetical protein
MKESIKVLLKHPLVKTQTDRAIGTQTSSFLDFINLTSSLTPHCPNGRWLGIKQCDRNRA